MKMYTAKKDLTSANVIVADDMFLTKDMPTTAGSKMLSGYMSLFDAEAKAKLDLAGYGIAGKAAVGEFGIDLLGESSFDGAVLKNGALACAAAEIVLSGEAFAALGLDTNGAQRRAAAQAGLAYIKPTYGTVSRFGTIPAACSGECVGVSARSAADCYEVLSAISGHDDKDGTSLSAAQCAAALEKGAAPKRVAVLSDMVSCADADVQAKISSAADAFKGAGAEVEVIECSVLMAARAAWNILMCAELCNNVSRYDGIKYGYRAENFVGLDELYVKSRTEAFGKLLKTAIIYGSEALSTENYMKVYDKALRIRRVISEKLAELFAKYDVLLLPAVSKTAYTDEAEDACFVENLYTAPASISGAPSAIAGGVQLLGANFSDGKLLSYAEIIEKEGV